MHPGCVKYLKNIKVIDETKIICCSSETKSDIVNGDLNSSSSSVETVIEAENIEIIYLKRLLKDKDKAIKYLEDNVVSLKEQIGLLNQIVSLQNVTLKNDKIQNHEDKETIKKTLIDNVQSAQKPREGALTETSKTKRKNGRHE
ncbi:unnamed protein product [Brassicogethes aeneus]|uniref:Uncharacterized protein n=1 Tax=Brassicogethes aeneus TaxID=1431903 RepID=A0A9P0B4P3_BRAAE|nr:unnamed protein product [Brassicogethes aeneus]